MKYFLLVNPSCYLTAKYYLWLSECMRGAGKIKKHMFGLIQSRIVTLIVSSVHSRAVAFDTTDSCGAYF